MLTERTANTPLYDSAQSANDSRYTTGRLNGQWRQRLGEARLEVNGGAGGFTSVNQTRREELGGVTSPRVVDDRRDARERTGLFNAKLSQLIGGDIAVPGSEHSVVGGVELEAAKRTETRRVSGSGAVDAGDSGDNLRASNLRLAAYVQDEWQLSPQWATSAGLRWEGIDTRGEDADGRRPSNRSSVWTPLLHAVWKPDAKSRDQVRFSLTRSYRSPGLGSLIATPAINSRFPASGGNEPLSPDRIGNPDLRPELATGIDVAAERYLASGGVLSANLFQRRIQDLIRSVTTLRSVPWSTAQRYVAQETNIGNATTQGLELEAKFRLDQMIDSAPPIDLRTNLSLFSSRVDAVPGPDNRLDQQARLVANVGVDYRFRSVPLLVGGNWNAVPGYRTQLSAEQAVSVGSKSVVDAYALWTFNPGLALRLTASNLTARDYNSGSRSDSSDSSDSMGPRIRETVSSVGPSSINWQLRLELKL